MSAQDEDEEVSAHSAIRYPCMPSLVAMQQMRNRLHLAGTGKKLMKWTAMATGRELRRLAKELDASYKTFREEMSFCYILLARARYSNPYFNHIILENITDEAAVRVRSTQKSLTGAKSIQLNVIDTGNVCYTHLGIGRGGETISQARTAWQELLKKIIAMCQQRISYMLVEIANKNATKVNECKVTQCIDSKLVLLHKLRTAAKLLQNFVLISPDSFSMGDDYKGVMTCNSAPGQLV